MFGNPLRRVISMDVSGSSVKIAQVANRGPKRPPLIEIFLYEKIRDVEELKSFLSSIKGNLNLKKSQVVIVLHGIQTIYRLLEIPHLDGVELEKAIHYEEEVYIPFPSEDRIVDWRIVHETEETLSVALAGARYSAVEEFVAPFREVELPLYSAEISGLALANLFSTFNVSDDTVVLLDVGAKFTTFVIMAKDLPVIIREISIGGDLFTDHIEDVLHLTKEEAELLKCNPGEKMEDLKVALEPIFYRFAEEVKVSMEYTGQLSINKATKVFLSGGGSKAPGLRDYLAKSLQIPVENWDVLSRFELGKGVNKDTLLVRKDMIHACLGAGLL